MNSYSQIQKELLNETLLMEVQCQNISYLRIGGYNARPYSLNLNLKEDIRTSKLKGYLRWYTRTLFLGSYTTAETYKEVENEILDKILGSESKDKGASKIRIKVDYNIEEKYYIDFQEYIFNSIDRYIHELLNLISSYLKSDFYNKHKIMIKISINPSDIYIQFYSENNFNRICNDLFKNLSNFNNKILDIFTIESKKLECKFNKGKKLYESNRIKLSFKGELDKFGNIVNLSRIKLLLMKREKQGELDEIEGALNEKNEKYINRIKEDLLFYPPNALQINLKVYIDNSLLVKNNELSFVREVIGILSSLILMLILGGLSALSSRGFAGVKINNIKINENISNEKEWSEFVKIIKELVSIEDKDSLIKNIKLLLKINKINEFSKRPKVPTITLEDKYFKIEAIKIPEDKDLLDVLKVVNESVLKSKWKPSRRLSGEEYHTWILGLPRFQRKTGYIAVVYDKEDETFRRKSAIGINVFESTKNIKFVIIHGFLSEDWPLYIFDKKYILRWYSNGYHKNVEDIIINQNKSIEEIFKDAFNSVRDYIKEKLSEKK